MKPETRLKKEIASLEAELIARKTAVSKGWKIYEGEPIQAQIYCIERDIAILRFRVKKLENAAANINNEIEDLKLRLKVFKDLHVAGYGVFHGVKVIDEIQKLSLIIGSEN
jgi:predicted RNase H-like nuclease (RuvC/YqgF family)